MNRVTEAMTLLAACLCNQIREDESPEPCFCGILPGDSAVGDYAGTCPEGPCGMAWARLITSYPSKGVGLVDEGVGNCGNELGFDVEIGILRCFPYNEDPEQPPTAEEMLAAAEQQHKDMLTMQRAVYCCEAVPNKGSILSTYTPSGPLGGLYGGTFMVMMVV